MMKKRVFAGLIFLSMAGRSAAPADPDDLLQRTGRAVEQFWNQISAVNCVETVDQARLGDNGKIVYRQDAAFDYLLVLQLSGDELVVDESRVALKKSPGKNAPLLITNGFSTFQFIFHPYFQGSFEYSDPEPVAEAGKALVQVRFRQVRGARSPSVLRVRAREYPVEWQGTAWIDPQSGTIVRIAAGLASSMEDVGLKSLNADVRYAPMQFKEDPAPHWLPATATIEAETLRQHWRNVHTFSKYRHFSVDTKTTMEAPK
jgi:hypothetical protein